MGDAMLDVIVIGAGAAGMSAAYAAARAGCRVCVIDSNPIPGGQYHRRAMTAPPFRPAGCDDDEIWRRVQVRSATTVYSATAHDDGFLLRTRGDERHRDDVDALGTRRLVIATGAYDRQLPVPGWDLPGVMSGGGAQSLIKGSGVLPGARTIVAGTGPFLLAVAHSIIEAGGQVAAVVEANDPRHLARHPRGVLAGGLSKGGELARYVSSLARHRVPYLHRHRIRRIHGDEAVSGATIAAVDHEWRPREGTDRFVEADTIAIGFGFTAQSDLALQLGAAVHEGSDEGLAITVDEDQQTSIAGVFAAGETTGIGGVDLARVEGLLGGAAVARSLGRLDPLRDAARLRAQRTRMRALADALAAAFPLRSGWVDDLEPDTIVCRCEEVRAARVKEAIDELGARDARAVKLLTRAGMGWCQGRICSLVVERLCPGPATPHSQARAATRPLAVPVPLAAIAHSTAAPTDPISDPSD